MLRTWEREGGERSQLVPVTDVSDQETGSVGGGAVGEGTGTQGIGL